MNAFLVGRGVVDGLHHRDVHARHSVGDGREEFAEGGGDGEALKKRSHRMNITLGMVYKGFMNLKTRRLFSEFCEFLSLICSPKKHIPCVFLSLFSP